MGRPRYTRTASRQLTRAWLCSQASSTLEPCCTATHIERKPSCSLQLLAIETDSKSLVSFENVQLRIRLRPRGHLEQPAVRRPREAPRGLVCTFTGKSRRCPRPPHRQAGGLGGHARPRSLQGLERHTRG